MLFEQYFFGLYIVAFTFIIGWSVRPKLSGIDIPSNSGLECASTEAEKICVQITFFNHLLLMRLYYIFLVILLMEYDIQRF